MINKSIKSEFLFFFFKHKRLDNIRIHPRADHKRNPNVNERSNLRLPTNRFKTVIFNQPFYFAVPFANLSFHLRPASSSFHQPRRLSEQNLNYPYNPRAVSRLIKITLADLFLAHFTDGRWIAHLRDYGFKHLWIFSMFHQMFRIKFYSIYALQMFLLYMKMKLKINLRSFFIIYYFIRRFYFFLWYLLCRLSFCRLTFIYEDNHIWQHSCQFKMCFSLIFQVNCIIDVKIWCHIDIYRN